MDMPPIQYARTEGSVVAPKIAQHLELSRPKVGFVLVGGGWCRWACCLW